MPSTEHLHPATESAYRSCACREMDAQLAAGHRASYAVRRDLTCPLTGYRYGSAWLVKPLPKDTWERVTAILAKSDRRIEL